MYASVAVYNQAMPVITGPGGGGECDPYPLPDPLAVITDLLELPAWRGESPFDTNLCSEII